MPQITLYLTTYATDFKYLSSNWFLMLLPELVIFASARCRCWPAQRICWSAVGKPSRYTFCPPGFSRDLRNGSGAIDPPGTLFVHQVSIELLRWWMQVYFLERFPLLDSSFSFISRSLLNSQWHPIHRHQCELVFNALFDILLSIRHIYLDNICFIPSYIDWICSFLFRTPAP